ncbi:hypothetical protein [Stenotrophomonas phage SB2]|uniref:Uncharacterized protein n=1 Tax=Stenotrophomonas phage SB2 TaxID=3117468 RepID=A0ABZ2GYJ8_9CAUD
MDSLSIMFRPIDWWFGTVYQWECDHKAPAAASLIAVIGMVPIMLLAMPVSIMVGLVHMLGTGLFELGRMLWRSTHGS